MKGILAGVAVAAAALGAAFVVLPVYADESPAKVDTSKLPPLKDWPSKSPYTGNKEAVAIGSDAYGQNCARCHGLEMISGGIAPDLRKVPADQEGDDLFSERMHKGAQRNGATMMPVFFGLLPNEELWAIRAYIISKNIPE